MFTLDQMPLLPGQFNGREVSQVAASDLASVGANMGAFTMHLNDVIAFDATDAPLVVKQPINDKDDSPMQYFVACTRNGNPSWLTVGILSRRDADGKAIGEFQEKALLEPSFKEIYAHLLSGKTITCKSMVDKEFSVFKDGVRTDARQTRKVPVIEYAA